MIIMNHPVIRCLIATVRWTPVFFVCLILSWAYYAYNVELCWLTVTNIFERVVYMVSFHVLLILLLWSYVQTTFTLMPTPPIEKYRLPAYVLDEYLKATTLSDRNDVLEAFSSQLPLQTRSYEGGVRYCAKCVSIKPDRAHHCGVCGVCLLKMDHHCPWVNSCVHFGNYKYFVLFLGYGLLFCLYVFFTDMRFFIMSWQPNTEPFVSRQRGKFQILFLFFVSAMFAISVSCLFFYHLYLTSKNRSTVEACYAPTFRTGCDKDGFNLGVADNFRQIFGPFGMKAFLPVPTWPGDGVSFPSRRVHNVHRNYDAMASSPGEGASPTTSFTGGGQLYGLDEERGFGGDGNDIDRRDSYRLSGVVVGRPEPPGNNAANREEVAARLNTAPAKQSAGRLARGVVSRQASLSWLTKTQRRFMQPAGRKSLQPLLANKYNSAPPLIPLRSSFRRPPMPPLATRISHSDDSLCRRQLLTVCDEDDNDLTSSN